MNEVAVGTIKELLNEYGEVVVAALNDNIKFKGNNASGKLADSIDFKVFSVGDVHTFELFIDDSYKWVDQGTKPSTKYTKPGRKMVNSILMWLSYKQVSGIVKSKKTRITSTNISAQKSMAYAIATNILKHGTTKRFGYKGSGFYSDVFKEGGVGNIQELEVRIGEVLRQSVKIQITGDLGSVS